MPSTEENFLSSLAAASLDDFYSALGGGAILLHDAKDALDEAGILPEILGWTSLNITGPNNTNQPGVLAYLAGLVSRVGGNILRTVNNTYPDGSFTLRWVIKGLDEEKKKELYKIFNECKIQLTKVDIV